MSFYRKHNETGQLQKITFHDGSEPDSNLVIIAKDCMADSNEYEETIYTDKIEDKKSSDKRSWFNF